MNETAIFSDSFSALETQCDVVFTNLDQKSAERTFQKIKEEILYLEQRLSHFIEDSPVSELNRAGAGKWLPVPDDIWNVLTLCFDYYQMSNGAFDITVAPLKRLWQNSKTPSLKEIKKVKEKCGFNKVEFDFKRRQIQFLINEVEFDFGAIWKGMALDTIKPLLKARGVVNGIISFGESSILALGTHPNGQPWPLGIQNIFQPNTFVHVFSAKNETLTTSGTILNPGDEGVLKRKDIISPADGNPVVANKTVSVKTASATMGEFLSTIWLILPEGDKSILLEQLEAIEILEINYTKNNEAETKLTIIE